MSAPATSSRPFEPGTTGWTIGDLDDPEIERQWELGAYELVDGVLTKMPPAYFDSGACLQNLIFCIREHCKKNAFDLTPATEADLILGADRLACVDAVFLTPEQKDHQRKLYAANPKKRPNVRYGRLLLPPTLIIESTSPGHESHDRQTKRRWYAEARVPNYWILDGYAKSLECLLLDGQTYRIDQSGRDNDELRPSLFPGLVIALAELWK